MIHVSARSEPLDLAGLMATVGQAGAVATFTGHVRADDGVSCLELEHYPGATEKALEAIATEATTRWNLSSAVIAHRVGPMAPGEAIVFVAAAAPHRQAALDACAYLIDRLKTDAPFWKKETRGATASWVAPRETDADASERWSR